MRKKTLFLIMMIIPFLLFAEPESNKKYKNIKECNKPLLNASLSSLVEEDTDILLFHLYPQLHEDYFLSRVIYNEFLKRQKFLTPDMQGVKVSYVLYRLKFLNCMIKVFSDDNPLRWNGLMFYDYEKNRLLLVRFNDSYPLEKRDFYLRNIELKMCSTIEYFDLNKGIYEFAAAGLLSFYNSNIEIKKDKIQIGLKILKGTFPGIDRDYCCKESIPITDEIRAFFKYTERIYPGKSTFRKHLEKIDRETYKRFEKFAKSPEGKKYKVFMTSNQEMNIVFLKKVREEKEREKQKEQPKNKLKKPQHNEKQK